MSKHPNERVSTRYNWVVEPKDEHGDIVSCEYWEETNLDAALANYADEMKAGHASVAFGLCRQRGSDCEGETDRGYAYRDPETGDWPECFDDGAAIPARFAWAFGRVAAAA